MTNPKPFDPTTTAGHISVAGAERWWIEKAREDPYYFIWYVTGLQPARHHKMWLALMFDSHKKRCNFISSREFAKTTIATYALAWLMSRYPLLTFGIVAVSATIARDRLSMIRHLIGENLRYKNVFPWIHVDKRNPDTQDEFSIWSDYEGMDYRSWRSAIANSKSELVKNPSIFAAGNGGKGIIGRRISGAFLLDDMVDDSFLSDDLQTKMMKYIVSVLEPCVTATGRIWNIGTRWMVNDIYERLSGNPMWHTLTIPAIIYDKDHKPHATWPEYWPLERLEEKRKTMDDDILFRIMYLCDPSAITGALFTMEALKRDLPEILPRFVRTYVLMDSASSMQTYADWNVIYIVGEDDDRNLFITDGIRFKDEGEDVVDRMIQMWEAAFLLYDVRPELWLEVANAEGIYRSLLTARRPDIAIRAIKPRFDKMTRAKQVAYWMLRGKMFINQKLTFIQNLHSEWFNFPAHKHDDTLDPISMLFQELNYARIQANLMRVKPTASALSQLRKKRMDQKHQSS